MSYFTSHTTVHELTFLKHIGMFRIKNHNLTGNEKKQARIELLTKYLNTMPLRENWDGLDYGKIRNYVKKELEDLEDKEK